MKRLSSIVFLFLLLVIAHHMIVYIHEWAHGTIAWLAGYKSSPFDIYYGERWFTMWDIDEAVDYQRIYSDGKAYIVAWIAFFPTLLEMILFPIGLWILKKKQIQKNWTAFAFFYFFTLVMLAEVYAYIPIRTFSGSDDMYNFVTASKISPWVVAILGTGYVIWGMYEILTKALPAAYSSLKITSKLGKWSFEGFTLLIFFGYFGSVGFTKPDIVSRSLSWASWSILLFFLLVLTYKASRRKKKS